MPISCVYCGGSHPDGRAARACWERSQGEVGGPTTNPVANSTTNAAANHLPFEPGPDAPIDTWFDDAPPPPELELGAPPPPTARARPRRAVAPVPAGRGPAVLGRHVLVTPGTRSPAEWQGCAVVDLDAAALVDPAGCVRLLRQAGVERTGLVVEVSTDVLAQLARPERADLAPHEAGPRFEFERATLHHLLTANAVDATGDVPTWWVLQHALELGAEPAPPGTGDVVLPDGTTVWLDGGPVQWRAPIDGVGVVHRVAVEHGSLVPFGPNTAGGSVAELAPDQHAAVVHDGGAARIIAPAGSGKTRVLTERTRHLVRAWRLPPSAISLVAFNKRAQEEMRERLPDMRGIQVRTLNAIALAIVNGTPPFAPRPRRYETIDEGEVRRLIGRLVRFPRKRNADPVATWIEALSLARLGLRSPERVESIYDGDVEGFAEVFPRYRRELERAGKVDFDEQVQKALEILLDDPVARAAAQRACRLMLVDEFQDLTPAHLLLVRLLAGPDAAVFGVGDDDQTIYGYNGADPAWLIDFAELFPGAGEHPLEVNYRCPADVVAGADMLLRHNAVRVPKVIRARNGAVEHGLFVESSDDRAASTVDVTVDLISRAVADGTPPSDIAVLTRVNSLLAPVQVALGAAGVPVAGGVGREFAERTAVRAALAWLRLATADDRFDTDDVAEALRRPSRSLHPNVAQWVGEQSSVDGLRKLAARVNGERDAMRIEEFAADIERLRRLAANRGTTASILGALRDSMGLASSIATLDTHRRGMNRAAQNDDLTAIAQLAELQPDPRRFERWLRAGLSRPWEPGGVTLATVHRVKGQEWPLVVVHQADADQFPHRLADDTAEERRVFHVAITRGSRRVHVVPGDIPSPFVRQMSEPPAPKPERAGRLAEPATRPSGAPASARPGQSLTGDDAVLFERLKDWRRHAAAGKPAYTVLADAALEAIVRLRPSSLQELSAVKGVGPSKLRMYGEALLAIVAAD
ncbi:MAG: ATP-dependent DNA helicase UvrD2 [Acidimicrobiales bacterium]